MKKIILDNAFLCASQDVEIPSLKNMLNAYRALGCYGVGYELDNRILAEIIIKIASGIVLELNMTYFHNDDLDDDYNKQAIPCELGYDFNADSLHQKILKEERSK